MQNAGEQMKEFKKKETNRKNLKGTRTARRM